MSTRIQVMLFCCVSAFYFFVPTLAYAQLVAGQTISGDRSLAMVQEESFDQKLNRFRHCYGVHVSYANASDGRRRACKALLVHRLSAVLDEPGTYFNTALHFECQNTGAGLTEIIGWQSKPVFRLKPNQEYEVLDKALQNYLVKSPRAELWERAQKSCDFYLNCRNSLTLDKLNFRSLRRCFWNTESEIVTRILQRELISAVFERESDGFIVPRFLETGNL